MNINNEIDEVLKLSGVQINENNNETPITDEEKQIFQDIYDNHLNLVNYYASKINRNFPNHDKDKFDDEFYIPYVKGFTRNKESLSPEEYKQFKEAQNQHYIRNRHHPEYWIANTNIENMGDSTLIEMCADWCAMSTVFGNTPFEWADSVIGTKYNFNENQIYFIYQILEMMWGRKSYYESKTSSVNNKLLESSFEIKNIKFYENPSIRWIKAQLNKGINLRIAIDGDLNEPYFGEWIVWDAKLANHQKAFDLLGLYEDDNIELQLTKDGIIYWGYNKEQIEKLNQCDKLNAIYPNGFKLYNEW